MFNRCPLRNMPDCRHFRFARAPQPMRKPHFLAPILALAWGLATAPAAMAGVGVLYGAVLSGPQPQARLVIALKCPAFAAAGSAATPDDAVATTDDSGGYAINAPTQARGPCQIRARRGATEGPPFNVFVSGGAQRFNLSVDGALRLAAR